MSPSALSGWLVTPRIVEPSLLMPYGMIPCDFLPTTRSAPVAGSTVTA